jgi:hypothetical protein
LYPGMQLVIDTERLWHVVCHPGPRPRYALITSWESSQAVDRWMHTQQAKPMITIPSVPAQGTRVARPVR